MNPQEQGSFWNSKFGCFIRWLLFLPIGFFLTLLIQNLTPLLVSWVVGQMSDVFMFLWFLMPLIGWFGLVALSQAMICGIAPNPKIAAPIYGTLFSLLAIIYAAGLVTRGYWVDLVYTIVIAVGTIFGILYAYNEF